MGNAATLNTPHTPGISRDFWRLNEYIGAVTWNRAGTHAAVGLSEGRVMILDGTRFGELGLVGVEVSEGPILALICDHDPEGWLMGTDDGRLLRLKPQGGVEVLMHAPGEWIESIASHRSGWRCAAVRNRVHLFDAAGKECLQLGPHDSTVAGICFDGSGSSIATAHYQGVSLWTWNGKLECRRLVFPGSHLSVSWSRDDRFIATSTQEKEVHVWDLVEGEDMRMSGYYFKVKAMSWTADGHWLVTSGADAAIGWGFEGKGPQGKPPKMFGPHTEGYVSFVACHPELPLVAIGFADGAVEISTLRNQKVAKPVIPPNGQPVTQLAWCPSGSQLLCGTKEGVLTLLTFRNE
ncbi:MAG: WD40 repeat domain-containing protein [Betaproteobacteria bacterium]|nr:WD40 repeat domain-containing protein [Betaproteobacteria bacterium]